MTKGYQKIKELVAAAADKTLMEMRQSLEGSMEIEALAVKTAIETELEKRGLLRFNEDTFEYEMA